MCRRLRRAAKYEVDDLVLVKELEQLGLPRGARARQCSPVACWRVHPHVHPCVARLPAEHAEAVGKPYSKERERLRSAVLASSLQLVRLLVLETSSSTCSFFMSPGCCARRSTGSPFAGTWSYLLHLAATGLQTRRRSRASSRACSWSLRLGATHLRM